MKSAKILVVVLALLIIGYSIYIFYSDPNPSKNLTPEENATLPTNKGTVISYQTDNYEISGRYVNENLIGSAEVNKYINDYISDFKNQANEEMPGLRKEGSAVSKYSLQIDTVSYAGAKYIFHVLTTGEYTGGASANTTVMTFAYRVSDNARVNLDEFVSEQKRGNFIVLLKSKLLANDNLSSVFIDVIKDISFEDLKNYYIYDGNLVILFSKYEVAPGSVGTVAIKIPLSEI